MWKWLKTADFRAFSTPRNKIAKRRLTRLQHPPYMAAHRSGAAGFRLAPFVSVANIERTASPPAINRGTIVVRFFCWMAL